MSAAGLDTLIWQCPVVLLADVRSVGVQGDGRSYGHPVVLRPVTSEDAMTADWARLPDDVLARISTRITNEVPEINRVATKHRMKMPKEFVLITKQLLYFDRYAKLLAPKLNIFTDVRLVMSLMADVTKARAMREASAAS